MKAVYARLGRTQEWTALIAGLRAKHRPKRSLTEVLDRLEGISKKAGKIIGGRGGRGKNAQLSTLNSQGG